MTTQYTPSPWELRHERTRNGKTDHVIRMGKAACYFNRGIGQTDLEAQANARLIAAAPELLRACLAAIQVVSEIADIDSETRAGWAHKQLQAAISKATSV